VTDVLCVHALIRSRAAHGRGALGESATPSVRTVDDSLTTTRANNGEHARETISWISLV
jgi:hypothetical protein